MLRLLIIVLCCLLFVGCTVNHKIMLGDERVIVQYQPGKGKSFVHLHQNETTALQAIKYVHAKEGGSYLTLIHSGERNIVFHLDSQRFEFDPNRIFSDAGIKKTLAQYSTYTPRAHQEVKKLASAIKKLLPPGKVVAVHNNKTYSFKNYLPGHDLAKEISKYYLNPDQYYRNFYLVTQAQEYGRLTSQGFNTVLQSKSVTDDGSLSVFLAHHNYINVEAGYDQLSEQIDMLKYA